MSVVLASSVADRLVVLVRRWLTWQQADQSRSDHCGLRFVAEGELRVALTVELAVVEALWAAVKEAGL